MKTEDAILELSVLRQSLKSSRHRMEQFAGPDVEEARRLARQVEALDAAIQTMRAVRDGVSNRSGA